MNDEKEQDNRALTIDLPWHIIGAIFLHCDDTWGEKARKVLQECARPWAFVFQENGGKIIVQGFDTYDECAKAVGAEHVKGSYVIAVLKDGVQRKKVKVETNVKVRL